MSYAIDIFAPNGTKKQQIKLDAIFSDEAINETLVHEYVVMYLANQRQNTAKAKRRGEITGSGKKLFRQKGTGRARVGAANSPIRRKWWVAFGPLNTRNRTKKMNQKMKQKALLSSLVMKLQVTQVSGIENLVYAAPKTKEAFDALQALSLAETKTLLVVDSHVENTYKSRRNIDTVSVTTVALVNPYDILTHKHVLFTQEALAKLTSRFHLLTQSV
jgi:large subunit ribosomal protein L4